MACGRAGNRIGSGMKLLIDMNLSSAAPGHFLRKRFGAAAYVGLLI